MYTTLFAKISYSRCIKIEIHLYPPPTPPKQQKKKTPFKILRIRRRKCFHGRIYSSRGCSCCLFCQPSFGLLAHRSRRWKSHRAPRLGAGEFSLATEDTKIRNRPQVWHRPGSAVTNLTAGPRQHSIPGSSAQPKSRSRIPAAPVKSTSVHKFAATGGLLEGEPEPGLSSAVATSHRVLLQKLPHRPGARPHRAGGGGFPDKSSSPLTLVYFPAFPDE